MRAKYKIKYNANRLDKDGFLFRKVDAKEIIYQKVIVDKQLILSVVKYLNILDDVWHEEVQLKSRLDVFCLLNINSYKELKTFLKLIETKK